MMQRVDRARPMPPPLHPMGTSERDWRLERLWMHMNESGIAALVLTSEPNFRYVTNFRSPTWVTTTRPRFAIVPLDALPIIVAPASNAVVAQSSGWIEDVRLWPAPRPQDDGISLVVEAMRKPLETDGKIGFEIGHGSRLGFPATDFLRLLETIGKDRLIDATTVMEKTRSIKSTEEIVRHELAARAASHALNQLVPIARASGTDRELHRNLQIALVDAGLHKIPYLVCASGPFGYVATNSEPEDRAFSSDDVVYLDVGGTIDGYFCDFNRHVAFGHTDDLTKDTYSIVHTALDAGIKAARPGRPVKDIWFAMASHLDNTGRFRRESEEWVTQLD